MIWSPQDPGTKGRPCRAETERRGGRGACLDPPHHHRHRPRPGRRHRDPSRAGEPRDRGPRHHQRRRQRAAGADHEERAQGRRARRARATSRSMPARRRRWCASSSPPRRCTARPASTARTCRSRRSTPREGHAVDFIVETLRREPAGSVTLCVARSDDQHRHGLRAGARDRRAGWRGSSPWAAPGPRAATPRRRPSSTSTPTRTRRTPSSAPGRPSCCTRSTSPTRP